MEKRVFSKKEFVVAAAKDFVLLEVDFPQGKEQSDELKKQNEGLMKSFGVEAFPTLLLCDAQGRPYAEAGFPEPMTPAGMEKILTEQKLVRMKRDAAFAAAEKAQGVAKAKLLVKALKLVPEAFVPGGYATTVDEIAKLDPEDETGFVKAAQAQRAFGELEAGFAELMESEKHDAAIALVDVYLAKNKPEGEARQKVLLFKFFGLATKEETAAAIKVIDEILKVDADTETAALAKQFKQQLDDR